MEIHCKVIGGLLVILALIHVAFPAYFKWKEDLKPLQLINRQMMVVHTFFLAFSLFLMGILCFFSSHDLVTTPLGKRISLGLGLFWAVRLFVQFFGYSPELWRGKTFETVIHILFSFLWAYLSGVFLMVYFG